MESLETQKQYEEALLKIEELLEKTAGDDNLANPEVALLNSISDLIAEFESKYYPIAKPSLIEVIKLRMYEMGIKQEDLAKLLEIPKSRVSEYLRGKREITLDVARKLHLKLKIDGDIILQ